MTDSHYTQRLESWLTTNHKQDSTQKRSAYGALFLAAKRDIIAAMDAGYDLKTIWMHMHETKRLPFRYETFLRHVHRHIK